MAGLRATNPRVADPGDVTVSGHRPQDRAYRPEVLARLAEERAKSLLENRPGGRDVPGSSRAGRGVSLM